MNQMKDIVPPKIIKQLEYKYKSLLKRLGFSLEAVQAIVCNHGYRTAKKLSCIKSNGIHIVFQTFHSPGGEQDQ